MIDNVRLKNLSHVKNNFLYKVEVGDDLKSVADRFHTTQRAIISLNGIEEDLRAGEYIVIEKITGEEYVIMPMDTLEKIANNDNEKLREIVRKNKIDFLYVGQKIYI